ncbi:hypothetical protein J8J27_23090, partial [Mycobacterium tuberculosis]|nr:hypothetical protein [Mycobacterium tuberculosis]
MSSPRPTPKAAPDAAAAAAPRLTAFVRAEAARLGFSAVGIAPAEAPAGAAERLRAAIAAGYHGEMHWLADTADRRAGPRQLWPEARTVIALGLNYGPG